jgi:hypothetical protein
LPKNQVEEDLIALRGSTDESIKAIEDKIKELDEKMTDKPPKDPKIKDPKGNEAYEKFIKEKEKFLKDKEKFEQQQKDSFLATFSKEEQEAYKELSINELALITKDRKMRKENLFLTDPDPIPDPTDKIVIGWGKPHNGVGYGWYNAKGQILSKDRNNPYGVKKE